MNTNCRCAFNPTNDLTVTAARQLVSTAKQQVTALRQSLAELHAGNAHTVLGYLSWKAFVKAEFGHSLSWFYRQVRAWEVQANLEAVAGKSVELSERALRELGKVEAGIQQVVYQAAHDATSGNVTEAAIRHASEAVQEVYVTGTYTDAEGNQISVQEIISGDTAGRMNEARQRQIGKLNHQMNIIWDSRDFSGYHTPEQIAIQVKAKMRKSFEQGKSLYVVVYEVNNNDQ